MPLTDMENCAVGVLCGAADCTLLQPTNYCESCVSL